jgi:HlyD family secretion protein
VKFDVPEPPPFLREDMTLSMQVATGRSERALTLPATAVIGPGLDARVRRLEDGRVVERPVRTGLRTLERVEIVDGLRAGDAVLVDPFAAEPGARARAAGDGEAVAGTRAGAGTPGAASGAGAAAANPGAAVGGR